MKRLFILAVALLVVLANGCLTMEQTIKIRQDDSLVANYSYTFSASQEEAVRAALAEFSPYGTILDEAALKAFYAARGAELTSYRKNEKNGMCSIQIIVIAKDAWKAIGAGAFGGMRLVAKDKLARLEIPMPPKEAMKGHRERAAKLLKGASFSLTVLAPKDIDMTNGKTLSDEICSWHFTTDEKDSLFDAPEVLFVQWKH